MGSLVVVEPGVVVVMVVVVIVVVVMVVVVVVMVVVVGSNRSHIGAVPMHMGFSGSKTASLSMVSCIA